MSKLSKRHFWEWFKRHQKEYIGLNKMPKKEAAYWLSEMTAHLRSYFKSFGFSLTLHENQAATLTITVNGKAKHFKRVEAFVATAPEIPGWTVRTLEDPMPVDFLLNKQMEEAGIDPREFYFSFASDHPEAGIIVYHPLCTEENKHVLAQLAYAAVYNLLGERSFGLDIGNVEVDNLSSADDDDEIQKLEELTAAVAARRSSMIVDDQGRLLDMD